MTPTVLSSGLLTSDTLIHTGRGLYHGVTVSSQGAGASVVTVYDGTDNTGLVLDKLSVAGGEPDLFHSFNRPVRVTEGIFVEVATDTETVVYFG